MANTAGSGPLIKNTTFLNSPMNLIARLLRGEERAEIKKGKESNSLHATHGSKKECR